MLAGVIRSYTSNNEKKKVNFIHLFFKILIQGYIWSVSWYEIEELAPVHISFHGALPVAGHVPLPGPRG